MANARVLNQTEVESYDDFGVRGWNRTSFSEFAIQMTSKVNPHAWRKVEESNPEPFGSHRVQTGLPTIWQYLPNLAESAGFEPAWLLHLRH